MGAPGRTNTLDALVGRTVLCPAGAATVQVEPCRLGKRCATTRCMAVVLQCLRVGGRVEVRSCTHTRVNDV
jgi:hypothetical protein